MSLLFAWDIDGTLLKSGGAGRSALDRAFTDCFGVAGVFESVDFRGRTDPSLIREAFQKALRPFSEAEGEELKEAYLKFLQEELVRKSALMKVFPGVEEAIQATAQRGTNALLTGNWAEGARHKLSAAGLDHHFEWGAFGGDGPDRNALVPALLKKAEQRGLAVDKVVVIGDTPADVACARAGGALAVIVETGSCEHEELEATNPDLLLVDLQEGLGELLSFLDA